MNDITSGLVNFTTHPTPVVGASVLVGGAFVLVCGLVQLFGVPTEIPNDFVTVSFLNVGQGDAILVQTSASNALVDAGPDDAVLDELVGALPSFRRHVGVVVASHSDADHIGGLPGVLSRYSYDVFAATGVNKKSAIRDELNKLTASTTIWNLAAGDRIVLDPYNNVLMDVLWPPSATIETAQTDDNELSLVMRLYYGSSSVLLTGDAGVPTERELIRCFGSGLASTVLKVGHHGSDSSTSVDFLSTVSPKVAVISAGAENRYGHPHQSVVDMLSQALNSENIHITKDEGRVTFVLSQAGIALKP